MASWLNDIRIISFIRLMLEGNFILHQCITTLCINQNASYYIRDSLKIQYACVASTRNAELFYSISIGNPNVESALPDLKQVCVIMIIMWCMTL